MYTTQLNKLLNRYVRPKILSGGTRHFNGLCIKQFYNVAVPAYCGVPRALVKEFSSPYQTVRVGRAGHPQSHSIDGRE